MLEFKMVVEGTEIIGKTHDNPHPDEMTARWLIEKFGNEDFVKRYAPDGIIALGIEGGSFDEHPVNGDRKEGKCCAILVAEALGVDDNPALEKLLSFITNNDLKGISHPFDIAYIANLRHRQFPGDPEKVYQLFKTDLETKFWELSQFWTETKNEFEKVALIENVSCPGGRQYKIATIVSDNEQVGKFARSAHGGQAAIVIQKRSSGNVQIYTNKKFGLTLYDVAKMLNIAEQETNGGIEITDWKTLSAEGKIPEGKWYFQYAGQMLLNGSLTAKDVPPTNIPLEKIREMVKIGINPSLFEPQHENDCKRVICTSTRYSRCPWYKWGLQRCRRIRFEMKK